MKSSTLVIFSFLLLLASTNIQAQAYKQKIYNSFISGRMDRWQSTMEDMEVEWMNTGSYDVLYDLTEAYYGYIAYLIGKKEKKKAARYILKAEEFIELMLDHNDNWVGPHALKGAIYGLKVGLEPLKAIIYGPKSFDENRRAMELDPENPQVWMEAGNIELYKPAIFGGNKKDAVDNFLKAVAFYERDPAQIEYSWLYLNTLSGLASSYTRTDHLRKANETYLKILRIEPDFKWIRDEVYPGFRDKYGY